MGLSDVKNKLAYCLIQLFEKENRLKKYLINNDIDLKTRIFILQSLYEVYDWITEKEYPSYIRLVNQLCGCNLETDSFKQIFLTVSPTQFFEEEWVGEDYCCEKYEQIWIGVNPLCEDDMLPEEISNAILQLQTQINILTNGGTVDLSALQTSLDNLSTKIPSSVAVVVIDATNGAPVTIPKNNKGFSIINLGLNGLGEVFANIALSGGLVYTMKAAQASFGITRESGTISNNDIIVTPTASHIACVTYMI